MNVGYILTQKAKQIGDSEAVVFEGKRLTYRDLNNRANRLANAFLDIGIEKGNHVLLLSQNCNEFMEAYFALAKIGGVLVPVNWRLAPREIEYICTNSQSVAFLVQDDYVPVVNSIREKLGGVNNYICIGQGTPGNMKSYDELLEAYPASEPELEWEVGLDDDVAIIYTSGTTGRPKGAIHTHAGHLWHAANSAIGFQVTQKDISLVCCPLFHVAGFHNFSFHMYYVGGKAILHRRFDETKIFEDIEREKVALLFAVSSMVVRLVEHPNVGRHDMSSLRKIWTGAEPFPIPTIRKIKETWPAVEFIQAYGFTEGISTTSFLEDKFAISKIGSVGKPFYGVEAMVVDEQGNEVPPGGIGELVQKGTQVMREYWNKPPEAGPTFDEKGWYHSGDLVRLDKEGYMYIVSRIKDMIISGGENIYPAEVEQVLYTHPKIKEAAVIGVPDKKWGEAVKAIVVLQPGEEMTQEEVIEHCKENIASYKKPKSVEFMEELPRLASGKIAKVELKQMYGKPR